MDANDGLRLTSAYDAWSEEGVRCYERLRNRSLDGVRFRISPSRSTVPSAPVRTDQSVRSAGLPPRAANGELPAPAPPSQRLDGGAGAGISFVEAEAGRVEEGEEGAEGKCGIGSWRGRLTARDKELVSHLGLVRYLRTDQIAELVFPGRAQSVISGRLGELSERHGNTRALIKKLWFVNSEGKRVLVW